MRYQGRISGRQDDKGFGFVTPNGGGQRAFIHMNAFANRRRRPVGTEIVIYEIVYDPMGRAQAENVRFADERTQRAPQAGRGMFAPLCASVFLMAIGAAAWAGRLSPLFPAAYAALGVLTFLAYAIDKSAARNGRWRTQESTLHLFSLLGGWPGALAAQRLLKHKSIKTEFQSVFRVTAVLHCVALAWLLWSHGGFPLATFGGA
jgi:uncharacterized membrane protein YsdA (DUF1294 family)/cold shock CspA family protein